MSQTYFQTALTLGLLGHKNAMVFVQFSSDLRIHSRYVRKDITISKINLTNDICVFFVFLEAACCYLLLHGRQRQFLDTYKTAVNFRDHSWKSLLCWLLAPILAVIETANSVITNASEKYESFIFLLTKSLPNLSMENRKFPLWGSRYPKEEANTQMIATEIT